MSEDDENGLRRTIIGTTMSTYYKYWLKTTISLQEQYTLSFKGRKSDYKQSLKQRENGWKKSPALTAA